MQDQQGKSGGGGFSSMARNVGANWAGHALFIVSGFILPRFINDHLGQERLGVWDFGWATVSYFSLLTAGIASSVNRYVAKYRATGEWSLLNQTVSACACIFAVAALTGCAITLTIVQLLPRLLPPTFAPYLAEAQWLLLLLGLTASLDLFIPTFAGVISGAQRYDILASIESLCHFAMLGWIVLLLKLDWGLKAMGIPVLGMRAVEGVLKGVFAHRLCPQFRLSMSSVTAESLRRVFTFGAKTLFESSARLVLYQGNNLLVAFFLGPSAIAVYARSMALILHTNKLMFHFGRVFAPSASDLQAREDAGGLRELMLTSARYSSLLALPMVLVLCVFWAPLLRIWMGEGYATIPVLPVLALGHLAYQTQIGSFYVLMGMNRHGKSSAAVLMAALTSLTLSYVALKVFHVGLLGVAVSVALSVSIPYLLVVPRVGAAAVGATVGDLFRESVLKAAVFCIPFGVCLVIARSCFRGNDYLALASGLGVGAVVLGLSYWRWALPPSAKTRLSGLWKQANFVH